MMKLLSLLGDNMKHVTQFVKSTINPRPIEHVSSLEVIGVKNTLDYLKLRKSKMGGTKRIGEQFDRMINEIEQLQDENALLKDYINAIRLKKSTNNTKDLIETRIKRLDCDIQSMCDKKKQLENYIKRKK